MTWCIATHAPEAPWHWVGSSAIRIHKSVVPLCGFRMPLDRLRTGERLSPRMKTCDACERERARGRD